MSLTHEQLYEEIVNHPQIHITITLNRAEVEVLLKQLEAGMHMYSDGVNHNRHTCRRLFTNIASQVLGYRLIVDDPLAPLTPAKEEVKPSEPKSWLMNLPWFKKNG